MTINKSGRLLPIGRVLTADHFQIGTTKPNSASLSIGEFSRFPRLASGFGTIGEVYLLFM